MDTATIPNKQADVIFMDIIHEYRVIWDRGCHEFKDKNKKEAAWKMVAEESQKALPDLQLTSTTARTKYETLRSSLSRHLKECRKQLKSGAGTDDIVLETGFKHLAWLTPFIRHRAETESNVSVRKKSMPKTEIVVNDSELQTTIDSEDEQIRPPSSLSETPSTSSDATSTSTGRKIFQL